LSLSLRGASSPPPVTLQSATGEVIRLKRMHRFSSTDEDADAATAALIRDKMADLAYYSTSPGGGISATTITLPANAWSQSDIEHAAAIGG
jgi:hypothetical protein